ncbi:MAG: purine-nucleoside phosphorylase [Chlorobi bacterium]|nr:purine-nucleoside phosphorylase [Chlorobiota bacterium]
MLKKIKETTGYLQSRVEMMPEIGVVLGTGLGGFADTMEITHEIPYTEIPNFPVSTVDGHQGKLIFGHAGGKEVVAMQGRFHYYEGYEMEQIVFPIRVMRQLGIRYLFLSNASGGVNPDFQIGDLMIITDHINLLPNPLIGKHEPEFGSRFPDMGVTYDPELIRRAGKIAEDLKIPVKKGIYTATTGPTYETPAEYRYFRIIGSDAVGMSTVPETIVAHQMGVKCFAVSIITDLGVPGEIKTITHESVQEVAAVSGEKMSLLLLRLFETL